jgi:hypothetical protein
MFERNFQQNTIVYFKLELIPRRTLMNQKFINCQFMLITPKTF